MFNDLICQEIRQRRARVVVDIGAGPALISWLQPIRAEAPVLVGIDPNPMVESHPDLDRAVRSTLEDAPLGDLRADVAYAFNVVEHVRTPDEFLRKVHALLRPGASFWFFSSNEWHPFCALGHVARVGGLKRWYRDWLSRGETPGINDYPSYYRLNRVSRVARLARAAGFSRLEFARMCSGWESYFPPCLRFIARGYDALVQRWIPPGRLILVCRLTR